MGYHRLFSHKSFKTNVFIEWILMICGSVALQNTILKWCSDHRKHHNFPEMEKDPYSIKKRFLACSYWMDIRKNTKKLIIELLE